MIFKVGDCVIVSRVSDGAPSAYKKFVGAIGKVKRIDGDCARVDTTGDCNWFEDELEFYTDMFDSVAVDGIEVLI